MGNILHLKLNNSKSIKDRNEKNTHANVLKKLNILIFEWFEDLKEEKRAKNVWKKNNKQLQKNNSVLRLWIFSPCDQVSKKCIFRIHVDDWPKWCNTCMFTQKSISTWTASKSLPRGHVGERVMSVCWVSNDTAGFLL